MKTALVAMWLAGAALSTKGPVQKLTDKSGVVWTIRSEAGHSEEGLTVVAIHHLLRNGREVSKAESGTSRQRNPTMSSSTRWTFQIEDGVLKAIQERYESGTHGGGHTSVTPFTWDGKVLVPGTPVNTDEP